MHKHKKKTKEAQLSFCYQFLMYVDREKNSEAFFHEKHWYNHDNKFISEMDNYNPDTAL